MKKTLLNQALPVFLSVLILGFAAPGAIAQETAVPATGGETTIIDQTTASPPPAIQGMQTDFLPVKAASETDVVIDEANPTHDAVKLTPDKSELIRLGKKASAIIIGNPAHLSIVPEGSDTIVLVPKAPGATYFTVLGEDNQVIMQRHVIVASPKEKYIRIRKSCAGAKDCQPTQVYYCPDMCHEIMLNEGGQDKAKSDTAGKDGEAIEATSDADGGAEQDEPAAEEPTEE